MNTLTKLQKGDKPSKIHPLKLAGYIFSAAILLQLTGCGGASKSDTLYVPDVNTGGTTDTPSFTTLDQMKILEAKIVTEQKTVILEEGEVLDPTAEIPLVNSLQITFDGKNFSQLNLGESTPTTDWKDFYLDTDFRKAYLVKLLEHIGDTLILPNGVSLNSDNTKISWKDGTAIIVIKVELSDIQAAEFDNDLDQENPSLNIRYRGTSTLKASSLTEVTDLFSVGEPEISHENNTNTYEYNFSGPVDRVQLVGSTNVDGHEEGIIISITEGTINIQIPDDGTNSAYGYDAIITGIDGQTTKVTGIKQAALDPITDISGKCTVTSYAGQSQVIPTTVTGKNIVSFVTPNVVDTHGSHLAYPYPNVANNQPSTDTGSELIESSSMAKIGLAGTITEALSKLRPDDTIFPVQLGIGSTESGEWAINGGLLDQFLVQLKIQIDALKASGDCSNGLEASITFVQGEADAINGIDTDTTADNYSTIAEKIEAFYTSIQKKRNVIWVGMPKDILTNISDVRDSVNESMQSVASTYGDSYILPVALPHDDGVVDLHYNGKVGAGSTIAAEIHGKLVDQGY